MLKDTYSQPEQGILNLPIIIIEFLPAADGKYSPKADCYGLGHTKNKIYPSVSSISKPLKLSLLSCIGMLNVTASERYPSNNVSGSAVEMYASPGSPVMTCMMELVLHQE